MVGTMIATALSLTGFTFAATAFAINFAVSMIVTRVFGEDPQTPQDNGVREQVPPSNTNAVPIVYGDAYLGGTFVDAVLSTDQKTMYYVLAVSCISPNGQFSFDTTDMYFGDRQIAFDGTDQAKVVSLTDEAGNVDTKVNGNLWIYLYRSTDAGVITPLNSPYLPHLVMADVGIEPSLRWPSSGRQMNGLAFAIVKLNYNQEAGFTNLSPITFKAKQTLFGFGVAKPGHVWYDYITSQAYGGAVDPQFVDVYSRAVLNEYSDELITFQTYTGSPSTQARYRVNGVIDAGQSVLSNIDKLMTCCDSWMAYDASIGQWSVVVNKAESASFSFDDENIIGEIRVSATDITQSINQVEAKFPNKNARDQPDFVNLETPAGLLYPNEPVNKYSVTYDLINDSVTAQYLANRILEQAREDLIVSFNTTYYGIQVDAGSVVSVTNSDYGWTNKLFRVIKVNEASLPDGSLGARLEMTEYSAAVYDDFNITEYTPVPNSQIPSVSYFSSLSAPTISSSNPSSAIPNFDVSISIPVTGRVTYADLFYTTAPIPTASDWKLLSTATTIDGIPVTPGTTYVFSNQVLPTGASLTETYYFSYVVGNDLAKSVRSPISASFTWEPIANLGPTGPTGPDGLNTATVYLYNKSTTTTAPTLFSGTFTYTFSTAVLSGGTFNGWTQSAPGLVSGEYLFVSTATASSTTDTDTIEYTEFAVPQIVGASGLDGAQTAIVNLFRKNNSATVAPSSFSGTFTYTFSTAVLSGGTLNGWTQSAPTLTNGEYLWQRQATAYSTSSTDTIASTEFSSAVVVSIGGVNGATGPTGTSGNKVATVFLYQWATTTPGNPSGQTTYTWNPPGNATYTGGNGWQVTVPANPGTPLVKLWVASKQITDVATATTTTVSWTSGYTVSDQTQNGASGTQAAEAIVYQWATTIPTITGTSTYTWATGAVTSPPTGWYTTISDTGTPGQTLWAAKVDLVDSVTVTTTSVNWATAIIVPFGYVGTTGAVARTAYTATSTTLATTPSVYTVTGDAVPAIGSWGAGIVWTTTVPVLTAGQSVWQTNGVYNPTTNQTIWEVPYLSALKVGNLSALSTNTGSLNVSGNITVGASGNIRGGQTAYNTGTGFFLGYSGTTYKFSIGSSTTNMTWDGTSLAVKGGSITGSVLQTATSGQRVTINESNNNEINFYGDRGDGVTELLAAIGINSIGADSFIINAGTGNSEKIAALLQSKNKHAIQAYVYKNAAVPDSTVANGINISGYGAYTGGVFAYATGGTNNTGVFGWSGGSSGSNQFSRGVWGYSTNGTGVFASGAVYDFYAGGSGSNYGPFTGAHDGLVNNSETVEIGDIVVDVQVLYKYNISSCIFLNQKSSQPNQQGAIGVVSLIKPVTLESLPAALIEDYVIETNEIIPVPGAADIIQDRYRIMINAVGEGQVNVCGEGGDIAVGDLIVASSTPGKGMKQADDIVRSYTVARARQAVNFSSPSEVQLVACVYISG